MIFKTSQLDSIAYFFMLNFKNETQEVDEGGFIIKKNCKYV